MWVFTFIALFVVASDQFTKIWIRSFPEQRLIFEMGFFRIVRVHNTGAAFGLFQGYASVLTLVVLMVAVMFLILFVLYFFSAYPGFPFLDTNLGRVALGLVFGGTVGNLVDRLRFGSVTDFISVGIWPAFNIADSAIVVGAIILACSILLLARAGKRLDEEVI